MNEFKLKRKYGDRAGWNRVVQREFIQDFINEGSFRGHVTLIKVVKITEPLYVHYGDKEACIVDNSYTWLQHFPEGAHYSVTTMFDASGEIVQWYIDICYQIGIENGRPWLDDLYLDIIIFPTREVFLKDIDELELAFSSGNINEALYKMALTEFNLLKEKFEANEFDLLKLAKAHKEILEEKMKSL